MSSISHKIIETNGINLHVAIQGEGSLVVFCHGFPGHWSNWKQQLSDVAKAGYTAVAVDMRGYGESSRPNQVDDYNMDNQIADMLGLLDSFGVDKAIFVGQDFGAPLVWNMAVRESARVAAVVGISVPFDNDYYGRGCWGNVPTNDLPEEALNALVASPINPPSEGFNAIAKHQFLHAYYFQEIGPADKELGLNAKDFLSRMYWGLSAKGTLGDWSKHPSENIGYLDVLPPAPDLPWSWMSEEDMDIIVAGYEAVGSEKAFSGGLASYRVADTNWEIGAEYAALNIEVPALFIAGESDPVMATVDDALLDRMKQRVTDLRDIKIIPNAGHFVQLEKAEETSAAIIDFINAI